MYPTLIQFPHINSYPALLLLAFVFGYLLAVLRGRQAGISRNHIDNLTLILLIAGLAGARFFARYFYMKTGFWSAFKIWEGSGLVFYGGFIFCVVSILVYCIVRRLNKVALLDCLAPSVALGLALGRIGCFMGGCCWGDLCLSADQAKLIPSPSVQYQVQTFPSISQETFPLAVSYPRNSDVFTQHEKLGLVTRNSERSVPVHPVQLYEAALAMLLAFGLHQWSRKRKLMPGQVSVGLLTGYAIIRFATEFLRADNKPIYYGLTISQVISLVLLTTAFLSWLLILRHERKPAISKLPAAVPTSELKIAG